MSPSGEFKAFCAELSHEDEVALVAGATLDEVLAHAAERESVRCVAADAADDFDSAPTLRPASIGIASSELDDTGEGTIQ